MGECCSRPRGELQCSPHRAHMESLDFHSHPPGVPTPNSTPADSGLSPPPVHGGKDTPPHVQPSESKRQRKES